jgi:integrase
MRRRKPRSGSIYPRGGVYWIKFYRHGKSFRESSHSDSYEEAEHLLKRRQGEVVTGRFAGLGPERTRMSDLFAEVLEDYRLQKRASTDDVENRIRLHLNPAFGETRVADLSTQDLKRYVSTRRDAQAADATINRELAIVRRAFTLGAASDPPKVNRIIKIPRLREDNVRCGFLEHDQYIKLRNELPPHARLLLVIGYHTGIRSGELRKIRWNQVDFVAGEIRLSGPQTKNRRPRTVPIYGEMREWLLMTKEEHDQRWPTCEWVFAKNGHQVGDFRKVWEPACTRAAVPGLLFHDLRRSAVRNMERAGIPRKVAMEISGHRTESVYRRYDIVSKRDLMNAALKLERYLENENQSAQQGNTKAKTERAN